MFNNLSLKGGMMMQSGDAVIEAERSECVVIKNMTHEFPYEDSQEERWETVVKELRKEKMACYKGNSDCVVLSNDGPFDPEKIRKIRNLCRRHGIFVELDLCRITQR